MFFDLCIHMSVPIEERQKPLRIGITTGDPNGVGPETILRCFEDRRVLEMCTPIVYGSEEVLIFYRELLGIDGVDIEEIDDVSDARPQVLNLISTWEGGFKPEPGKKDGEAGEFAFRSLEKAAADIAEGKVGAMLTAPLHKRTVQTKERDFPGHTEYLTKYANMEEALMLMVNEELRVGVVSGHVPLGEVSSDLSQERIERKLEILEASLRQDFLIEKPLIAVLGLNPHAGESGMLGTEEKDMIIPALERCRNEKGIHCFGPYPADGFFGSRELGNYDAALAMYHDQGLAPFKALSFGRGVNFTAGLPIVRTSPDHGTAFGISGMGKASPTSFRNALYLALDLQRNRLAYKEMYANPLPPQEGSASTRSRKG